MQIQSGKLYENRTWKYLYPCLRSYGSTLKSYLNTLYKLSVGIGDYNIDVEEQLCIYILIDTNIVTPQTSLVNYRENIASFLDWFRFQPFFVADYLFDSEEGKEKHMLVIKIPNSHIKTYQKFIKGKYSEMYSSKEILEYFPYISLDNKEIEVKINNKAKIIRSILNKKSDYLPVFQKQLNEEFGVNCSLNDLKDHELDFPPDLKEEIFNYKKELIS